MVLSRLEAAERLPANQTPEMLGKLAEMRKIWEEAGLVDPGHTSETERLLQQLVIEFNTPPLTPELVTRTFRTIWQFRGEPLNMNFDVPLCPYTEEELEELDKEGKRLGYLPGELATQESRYILGQMFPRMQNPAVGRDNNMVNDQDISGWFDYEIGEAPYLGTNEVELYRRAAENERTLLSLNQYIIGGQDSKLFTGEYLDVSRTWVRVGSRRDGLLVGARFRSNGYLYVGSGLNPDDTAPGLGGRTTENRT